MDGLLSSVLFMVFCFLWHVCFVNPSYLLELKHVPVFGEGVTCSFFGLSTPGHVASTCSGSCGCLVNRLQFYLYSCVVLWLIKEIILWVPMVFSMSVEGKAFSFNFINIIATQSNLYSDYLLNSFCLFRKRTGLFLLQPEDPLSILFPAIIQLFLY